MRPLESAVVVGCAGVGVGQTSAKANGAAACGDGGVGGDDVVHKIDRQGLHRASESRMISSCNGRNEVKPKYCLSKVNNGAAPDFIAAKVGQACRLSRKFLSGTGFQPV